MNNSNLKQSDKAIDELVVDASDCILGRIGSFIVKKALCGKRVVVLNAEKIVISGKKQNILNDLIIKRRLKSKSNPEHSPKFPRVPRLLVKKMLRGMLPWKTARGKMAFKHIIVYDDIPELYREAKLIPINTMWQKKPGTRYVSILDVCRYFGYSSKSKN